jgi:CARDB
MDVCPRPPGSFTASASLFCSNNASAVRVTWTDSSGASTYSIIRNNTVIASALTGNSYDDTSVSDGATYSYIVRATNNTGTTDATTQPLTVVDPCPRPPGALTLDASMFCSGSSARVFLEWTASTGALSYLLLRNNTPIATGITGTSYEDTSVTPSTGYTYVVRALNANGSTDSNPFAITPEPCDISTPRADLAVSNVSVSRVIVNAGETFDVTFTIANNGDAPAGGTQTRIYIGDTLVLGTASAPLAAGESRTETVSVTVPALPGGTHSVLVSVNGDRTVDESSFDNNNASAAIEIPRGQCSVSCLVLSPTRALVGQTVAFGLVQPPSCPGTTVVWQFGNGAIVTGETATTSYNTVAVYTWNVVITVDGEPACTNTGSIEVTTLPRRRAARK